MALPLEWPRLARKSWPQVLIALRTWPWSVLATLLAMALGLIAALWGYQASAHSVTLTVDGTTRSLSTHQRLVGGVLRQAGLELGPADAVSPPLDSPWQPGQPIVVQRAYSFLDRKSVV